MAYSQILQIASLRKPLRTDYRHFVITDIEVIEVKSRKQGVIEQLLTRGSARERGTQFRGSEERSKITVYVANDSKRDTKKTTPLE